jgi:branched-chain amino acid transport system substrate-binding protein
MVGGTLDEFGLRDLIQVYCTTRQTARLTLTYSDATGHLYFDQGEIVHATLGPFSGRAAVHAALARKGGDFHVDVGLRPTQRTIHEPWSAIVLDGLPLPRTKTPAAEKSSDTTPSPAVGRSEPIAPPLMASAAPISSAETPYARPAQPAPAAPAIRSATSVASAAPAAPVPFAASPTLPPPVPVANGHPGPPSRPTPAPAHPRDPAFSFSPLKPEREAAVIPPRESVRTTATGMATATGSPAASRPTTPPFRPEPSRTPRIVGIGAVLIAIVAAGALYFRSAADSSVKEARIPARRKDTPILLGMSAAMTGPAKELGRQMKLGVETALNAANDAGGIHGHKFQLVALDDGYEPDRTKAAMKELVEDRKVFAIVGNVGTPTAEVSLPYVLEQKVPFFGAFTGAGILRKEPPDRYVFNYRASYVEETAAVVRYLVEVRKVRPNQIAVFAQQDGFGDAGFAGVTKALRKYGRDKDQVLRVGFKRNTLDIADALDGILKNRNTIKAVVMVAPYRPAARFIEKIKEQKFEPIFTNVSFVGSTALAEELRQLGPSYSNGVIVTQVVPPVDSSATAAIRYRDALQKYFRGEKPDFVSFEGYIAANVLLEGFRKAGADPTRESLVDALESIHGLDLGIGTPITFGLSEHQGSHKVWGTMLDDKANYQVFDLE